jgi:hypothetical protein
MKTSIRSISAHQVKIAYDDAYTGERIELLLHAPLTGGYVRDQHGKQMCARLAR